MISKNISTALGVMTVSLSVLLAGCGGGGGGASVPAEPSAPIDNNEQQTTIDVSEASIVTQATKGASDLTTRTGRGFSFPSFSTQGGVTSMTIPGGPLPQFPARRTVVNGTGQTIEFGDAVTLKYDMFSWSDGSLVESSSFFQEAHTVKAGISDAFPIPEYLAKSLLGRKLGDTLQVVLPAGTADLPAYLDKNDTYVLLVELL